MCVCVGGTWGRMQMCHRSCMLGGCRGSCESERADWAPGSRPWAGRVAACVERPRRSSQHWGLSAGDSFCFLLERTARALGALPARGVCSPCSKPSCSCSFRLLPCLLSFLSCSPSLPNPPLTSLSERVGVGGALTHPYPWVPAVPHPRASAPPRADLSPPQQGGPLAAGP